MSDQKNNDNQFDVPIVDHEYDGIQEFNNPAPFWWQLSFYLSIVFAIGYMFYYLVGTGPSSNTELAENMNAVELVQLQNKPTGPNESDLKALVSDPKALANGKEVYASKCAVCHAVDGGGQIGPNLADKFWIHGNGSLAGILTVVRDGVNDKGMPPWGAVLSGDEMKNVVVFVGSLAGTKTAQPKAPQGTEIK